MQRDVASGLHRGPPAGRPRILQPGTVFLPFHFAESPANALTSHEHLDPTVKIPALKLTPVRVEEAK